MIHSYFQPFGCSTSSFYFLLLVVCFLFLFCCLFLVKGILHNGCCNSKQLGSYRERLLCRYCHHCFLGQFLFQEHSRVSYFLMIFCNQYFVLFKTFKNYVETTLTTASDLDTETSKIKRENIKNNDNG